MKQFETTKLHYGKYQYKLVLSNQLNTIFRSSLQKSSALGYAREKLDQLTESYQKNEPMSEIVWRTTRTVPIDHYLDAKNIYSLLKFAEDYKIRLNPGRTLIIYSNDKALLKKISNKMKVSNREFWEPAAALSKFLQTEKNVILTNSVPEFPIKVTFGNNKINPDFINWLDANQDKSRVGKSTINNIRKGYFTSGLYFYVRDEKVLNLISMLVGHNIRRIDYLVYKKDIDKY